MKRVMKEIIRNKQEKRHKGNAKYSVSIPVDLIIEILAKLPLKPLAKLICVSKLWLSIIRSKDFTDFFLTRSQNRPYFLLTFHHEDHRIFLSVSQDAPSSGHQIQSTSIKTPDREFAITPPVRGLICCRIDSSVVISNPGTGQYVSLPKVKTRRRHISSFFGYDHVKDEYKVLSMTVLQVGYTRGPVVSEEHQVFTLGKAQNKTKTSSWRMINCNVPHCPAGTKGVCLNGAVYYGAWSNSRRKGSLIVRFDVRSEEFSHVSLPDRVEIKRHLQSEVVSYERKIALLIQLFKGKVELWVLEDVGKEEWSRIFVVVPSWEDLVKEDPFVTCRGVLSSGEFIFTSHPRTYPLYYISYDPKQNIATRVEVGRFGDRSSSMTVFLDYAECPVYFCNGRFIC